MECITKDIDTAMVIQVYEGDCNTNLVKIEHGQDSQTWFYDKDEQELYITEAVDERVINEEIDGHYLIARNDFGGDTYWGVNDIIPLKRFRKRVELVEEAAR